MNSIDYNKEIEIFEEIERQNPRVQKFENPFA